MPTVSETGSFISVTLDTSVFDRALASLKPPLLDAAVAKALADTQKNTKVKAASLIAKHMAVASARVKDRIGTPFVPLGRYVAVVTASKKPIPLIDFPSTRQNATGVATRAWGKPQTIRSAFVATMPTGHTGVYRRSSNSRLPIEQLWGPTIRGTFLTPDVAKVIEDTIRKRLPINLKRRIRAERRRR